jgi:hypothetical protein
MAELAKDDPRHGTVNGYGNHFCRCDACRAAHCAYHAKYMAKVRQTKELVKCRDVLHGTPYRYDVGCRCSECRAAHNAKSRETKARIRARRR